MTDHTSPSPGNERAADELLRDILDSLDDHKAENVVVIDLAGKSDIADYMVIASGQSSRQVATMADKLVEVAKKNGVKGVTPEGRAQADWVLFDAGDVIIHLFRPEVREFYNLEKMWNADLPIKSEPATF
ncbi:MAG: ribosome silencing factor [Rhodospirillaceae bacterium]|nr:MAG: ribosome silencing factor [Rhodospirillaceae bacterium]